MDQARLAFRAMATQWEILLYGNGESFLRSVAEEAMDEVRRLENQLSLFIPTSETSDLNRRATTTAVVVDPRYFRLLKVAIDLSEMTSGAFDITVAPLMRAWKFEADGGAMPTDEAIRSALGSVGYRHILLDAEATSVRFDVPGLQIDLGAIGKGYAVECAVEIIRDHGVTSGLMHGGTSTVYGLGTPPNSDGWRIAVPPPTDLAGKQFKYEFLLKDRALSVSAPHGKSFERDGVRYGHVIDPRSGYAISNHLLAAVATESATESDALSTALLTNGPEWLPELAKLRSGISAITTACRTGEIRTERLNLACRTP